MVFETWMSYADLAVQTGRIIENKLQQLCTVLSIQLPDKATAGQKFYPIKDYFNEKEQEAFASWLKIRNYYIHDIIFSFEKSEFIKNYETFNSALDFLINAYENEKGDQDKQETSDEKVDNEDINTGSGPPPPPPQNDDLNWPVIIIVGLVLFLMFLQIIDTLLGTHFGIQ